MATDENEKTEVETDEESTEDETDTEEATAEDSEESEEADDKESTDESDSTKTGTSKKEDELDLDKELEKERGGKPDKKKAGEAFKERQAKREDSTDTEEDDDRPLTVREANALLAKDRQDRLSESALTYARALAGSDKEAELIVAKWQNRSFPTNLSLSEQIEECYAITHRKKLIGERNEAMRGLKNRRGVNTAAANTHRDAPTGNAPKTSGAEAQAFIAAGMTLNPKTRMWEKKLANGNTMVRDPKTKETRIIKAQKQR